MACSFSCVFLHLRKYNGVIRVAMNIKEPSYETEGHTFETEIFNCYNYPKDLSFLITNHFLGLIYQ